MPLMKEGKVLFNDALNTLYLRLYGVCLIQRRRGGGGEGVKWMELKKIYKLRSLSRQNFKANINHLNAQTKV